MGIFFVKVVKLYKDHKKIGMDLRENLMNIKYYGIELWLEEQDKKWRCPSCEKPVSEEDKCHHCGKKLR